jgi:uncharacterized membrane protein
MIEHRDVVLGILGAASGLAGLTLVFLGLLVTAYQAEPNPSDRYRARYRQLGGAILISFVVSMACVAVATVWLVELRNIQALYVTVVASFFVSLAILLIATGFVVRRLLFRPTHHTRG